MKIAVFDFDGTLTDTKELYINAIYNSLKSHSFIHPKKAVEAALGPKLEMTLENIQKFLPKTIFSIKSHVNDAISKKAGAIKLCPHVPESLKKLKEKGYTILLLTNSTGKFVRLILKKNKILKYFDRLFYAENFTSKENAIKAIAKSYKISTSEIIYVADKLSDVRIAEDIGCRIFIVLACSWDRKYFTKHRKEYVIKSMKELYHLL